MSCSIPRNVVPVFTPLNCLSADDSIGVAELYRTWKDDLMGVVPSGLCFEIAGIVYDCIHVEDSVDE